MLFNSVFVAVCRFVFVFVYSHFYLYLCLTKFDVILLLPQAARRLWSLPWVEFERHLRPTSPASPTRTTPTFSSYLEMEIHDILKLCPWMTSHCWLFTFSPAKSKKILSHFHFFILFTFTLSPFSLSQVLSLNLIWLVSSFINLTIISSIVFHITWYYNW